MWGELESWGKAHPLALGLTIFAIGAVLIWLFSRGSSATNTSTSPTQPSDAYYQAQAAVAASGNQLQAAQLSAQSQANTVNAAVTANANQIAGQVALANIASNQAVATATIGADVTNKQTAASQESTDLASTLNALVQSKQVDASVNINTTNAIAATSQNATNATAQIVGDQIQYLLKNPGPISTQIPGVGNIQSGVPGPAEIQQLTPEQQNQWALGYLSKNYGVQAG